jgi:serine/threonine protein kinase
LAYEELLREDRPAAERHLEDCEACRTRYRELTAERFPSFPEYTILSEIDRGGFGIVYKAFHEGKARIEALKVLFGQTPLRAAYFENEVRLVSRLRHSNIATLYEAHLDSDPPYYAMEFVEGRQLDPYFRTNAVSLEERIEIIRTVAAAIQYAHTQEVVHRDLKPQNILIGADGQPHIVDFGISKRVQLASDEKDAGESAARRPEGAIGTYGYIAPEQIAGQPVDSRADIYGLGVLLYHVITGQPARFARNVGHLTKLLRERHVSRADDLAAIIAQAVKPVPEERYPTAAALVQDLENYRAGLPVRARHDPTPGYRIARVASLVLRNHHWAPLVLATVVGAILLSAVFHRVGARWVASPASPDQTALIAVKPSTLEAIARGDFSEQIPGLNPFDPKSRRLLYGRLMEHLAGAGLRVLTWDYFFPRCRPEYDDAFIRGVEALDAPVVIGSEKPGVDGEPNLCPQILAAVHGWGMLFSKDPENASMEIPVPVALQRGFNPLIPSLAVTGFAAARYPDSTVDLTQERDRLILRYRRMDAPEGQSRWYPQTDEIPIFETEEIDEGHQLLHAGDKPKLGRFPRGSIVEWSQRAIALEDVLAADAAQLREWFWGRAVLVGQMVPPMDLHKLTSGDEVFGCQIQATVLDTLFRQTHVYRYSRSDVALRVALWCLLAVVLASRWPAAHLSPPRIIAGASAICVPLGLALAYVSSGYLTSQWKIEAAVAVCALLCVGGLALLIRVLHERELRLTPIATWTPESADASTTLLVASPQRNSN